MLSQIVAQIQEHKNESKKLVNRIQTLLLGLHHDHKKITQVACQFLGEELVKGFEPYYLGLHDDHKNNNHTSSSPTLGWFARIA